MRAFLFVLLAADCLQLAFGLVALERGRRSLKAGAPSHARYSRVHGVLLLGGGLLLAVPVLLGLLDVMSASVAVYVALALELAALFVSRPTVRSFEAAHQARRPVAPPSR